MIQRGDTAPRDVLVEITHSVSGQWVGVEVEVPGALGDLAL
jgi:hypothetical protein